MRLLITFVIALLLSSCVGPLQRQSPAPEPGTDRQLEKALAPARPMTVEEQNEKAFEIFQEMYEMSGSLSPQELKTVRIEMYDRIINDYPDAGLAQEAHWKKVRIYLREFDPPAQADAERTYSNFEAHYPDSVLIPEVQNELIRFYLKKKMWEPMLRFTARIVQANPDKPLAMPLYYYGESSYQLDRKEEAKVAFEMAVQRIPRRSYLYQMAVDRLYELGGDIPADVKAEDRRRRGRK